MVDLEKQIEEAADLKYTKLSANPPYCEIKEKSAIRGFVEGAKSEAAKAYHTKGMYSEDEAKKLALLAAEHAQDYHMKFPYEWFDEWFEQNKKK